MDCVLEEVPMAKNTTIKSKIINSKIIYLWMAELLSMVITSSICLLLVAVLSSVGARQYQGTSILLLVIIVTLVVFSGIAWVRLWDMTKFLFAPSPETLIVEEGSDAIPREIGEPTTDIIRCLVINWIIMLISIAAFIAFRIIFWERYTL
jgi:hypothetical protein